MAIAEIASQKAQVREDGGGSGVASVAVAYPNNVTAGSLIVLPGGIWNASDFTVAVARSAGSASLVGGNDLNVILGATGLNWASGRGQAFLAYGIVQTGGSLTLTITPSVGSGNFINACTDEFSGVDTTTPLDVDGGEFLDLDEEDGNFTDSITTTTDDALIIGVIILASSFADLFEGTGYTELDQEGAADQQPYGVQWKIAGAAGAYNVDWVESGVPRSVSIINASFKPFTGGEPPLPADAVPARPLRSAMRW